MAACRDHPVPLSALPGTSLPASSSNLPAQRSPRFYVRNVEVGGSSPLTSTVYFGGPLRKPTISWAFVLFRCIPTGLSTGLSTEFVDGLSKLPYEALRRRARATPRARWFFGTGPLGWRGGAVCSPTAAVAVALITMVGSGEQAERLSGDD